MKRIWRDFLIPIVVALVVGGSSSYLTAQVLLENHEVRIKNLEDDVSDTKRNVEKIADSVNELKNLQIQLLTKQAQIVLSIEKLENTVSTKFDKYDDNIREFYLKYGSVLNQDR